jgi:hypothetical protein
MATITGNRAFDLVLSIVEQEKTKNVPLKSIYLHPLYYNWFRDGIKIVMGKDIEDEKGLQYDGIFIEKGDKRQSKPALLEYEQPLLNA